MRWYITVAFMVLLLAVAIQGLSARRRGKKRSRVSPLLRQARGQVTDAQISRISRSNKKRSWWKSPVVKVVAPQKSAQRASRRKSGTRGKKLSTEAKRKASKSHRSRYRGRSLRTGAWRNTKISTKKQRSQDSKKRNYNRRNGKQRKRARQKFKVKDGSYHKNGIRNYQNKDTNKIVNGLFTYRAEGNDNMFTRKFSRRARVLSKTGGVVIGRGYDLRERKPKEILETMRKAGMSDYTAKNLAGAAGLTGQRARIYIQEHLFDILISRTQQKALFKIMEHKLELSLKKLFRYHILVKRFGKLDWNKLNRAIKEIVIDLKFKGEFMPPARRLILPSIVGNRLVEFTKHMGNRTLWQHVPKERFELRAKYLRHACRKAKLC